MVELISRSNVTFSIFAKAVFLLTVITTSMILSTPSLVFAQISTGDVLVIDGAAGTDGLGALFKIDLTTGQRTIISNFGDSNQGPPGENPGGLDIDLSGKVLAIDTAAGTDDHGALFSIDPFSGQRAIVSDFGNSSQGPLGVDPLIVRIDSSGDALVVDNAAGTDELGALFRVDTSTGKRILLSDFGNSGQGPTGRDPSWVHVDTFGNVFVSEANAPTFSGSLIGVDPNTGQRTTLSNFGDNTQGPLGGDPEGLHRDRSGKILLADLNAGTDINGALFSVDPSTGQRAIISNFGNSGQGPTGISPYGLDIDGSGNVIVTDLDAGTDARGALFSVDPSTGQRTMISDFGNNGQGPLGLEPGDLVVLVSPQAIVDQINGMSLPKGVQTSLTAPLEQIQAILDDENPTNDKSACGKIAAFKNIVESKEEQRNLTGEQASNLIASAQQLESVLGC